VQSREVYDGVEKVKRENGVSGVLRQSLSCNARSDAE